MAHPGDQNWLWDSSQNEYSFVPQDAEFDVTAVECWNYQEGSPSSRPNAMHEKECFPISSVEAWLRKPNPTRSNHQLLSGFKVLIMPLTSNSLLPRMTRSGLDCIHAALNLPPVHRHSVSLATGANGMFWQPDGTYVFVHRKTASTISPNVTLCYDPATNVTQGVFQIAAIPLKSLDTIQSQYSLCSHPLFLLLLPLEISVELTIYRDLIKVERALRAIEGETGYVLNPTAEHAGSQATGNLRELIHRLGAAQSRMNFSFSNLRAARRSTEFIQQKLRYLNKSLPDGPRAKLNQPSKMMEERIEFLLSTIENALDYLALKERMETQQSVVFNLIAQMDGTVNIELAKDSREIAAASKRDSSAMKIVAVLTTVFLPGTFMATFFAMPLFDWSETSINNVANKHFWIYWAVTGPLTMVVVTGVASWAFLQSRRTERVAQLARRSTGLELASDDEGRVEGGSTRAGLTKRRSLV